MNCFNHTDTSAIGICKCCSKGLCSTCAVNLEHGLACKNKHEEQVEALNMIVTSISRIAQPFSFAPKNSFIKNMFLSPIFYLFMGLLFAGFGYFSLGGMTNLPFIVGVEFFVFALVVFVRNRQIIGKDV